MQFTTRQPIIDLATLVPSLRSLQERTVRLHPRRREQIDARSSKIGGAIAWPNNEPWPSCEETARPSHWQQDDWPLSAQQIGLAQVPLVSVLQLRADEFPEVQFFPGTDLLHLLWCPLEHEEPVFVAQPYVYWHRLEDVGSHQVTAPEFSLAKYIPEECQLFPEKLVEYPVAADLPELVLQELENALTPFTGGDVDDAISLYDWNLSACPGTKIGGKAMEHLLTLAGSEFDRGTYERWCPTEVVDVWGMNLDSRKRIQRPAFPGLSGSQLLFICHHCKGWPVRSVFQR